MTLETIFQQIDDLLDVTDGTLSEEQAAAMEELLTELGELEEEKVDRIVGWCKARMAHAEFLKKEGQSLATKGRAEENAVRRLKDHLIVVMTAAGRTKLAGKKYKMSLSTTSSCVVSDPDAVPEQYRKVSVDFDRAAAKKAMAGGEVIPGFEISQNTTIRMI